MEKMKTTLDHRSSRTKNRSSFCMFLLRIRYTLGHGAQNSLDCRCSARVMSCLLQSLCALDNAHTLLKLRSCSKNICPCYKARSHPRHHCPLWLRSCLAGSSCKCHLKLRLCAKNICLWHTAHSRPLHHYPPWSRTCQVDRHHTHQTL